MLDLIHRRHEITKDRLNKVIYFYSENQDKLKEFAKTHSEVIFTKNMEDLPNLVERNSLVVIDDNDAGIKDNSSITELFINGCHHRFCSAISYSTGKFFPLNKTYEFSFVCIIECFSKEISYRENSMYKVIFKQTAYKTTELAVGCQLAPGNPDYIRDSYEKATAVEYRPLIFDWHQFSEDHSRVRASLFPSDDCEVYCPE